jgi:Periplasmic protein involved in polysaccharide export
MKMKNLLFLLFPIVLFSCKSVPPDITYFQDIDQYREQLKQHVLEDKVFVIKDGDFLVITVTSPDLNQELVAQFNLPMFSILQLGETKTSESGQLQTYTVDKNGNIIFPILGEIHIGGMNKFEASHFLAEKISNYVAEPVVTVQIANFGVWVLGEVNNPGYIGLRSERMSILGAIGTASDLTIYGNRKNILIIRETNGTIEPGRIDLTTADLFFSPYYYLQQGDVVIVEPNDARKKDSKYGTSESYSLSSISLILSAISTLTTVAVLLFR